jgi:hypothetical protein
MTTTIYVQFADATEQSIISYFGCPQDATVYPNQGAISSTDSRWATFYDAFPAATQKSLPTPGA